MSRVKEIREESALADFAPKTALGGVVKVSWKQTGLSVKEIREAAGYSQSEAAALADCAPNTWRIWEIDQTAPTARMQARCGTATTAMLVKIKAEAA